MRQHLTVTFSEYKIMQMYYALAIKIKTWETVGKLFLCIGQNIFPDAEV